MSRRNPKDTHCYRCGSKEHNTSDCSHEKRVCFNCHEPGHDLRTCTKPRGVLNKTCGGCGKKGHVAGDCQDRQSWTCKKCTEKGHGHWECRRSKRYPDKQCRLCCCMGHIAKDCPTHPTKPCEYCKSIYHSTSSCLRARWRNNQEPLCTLCGRRGHLRQECSSRPPFKDELAEIIEQFTRALKVNTMGGGVLERDHRATLLLRRAMAYLESGNYTKGLKDVGDSLELRPNYSEALLCRARIMVGLRQFQNAIEDFRLVLKQLNASAAHTRREVEAELAEAERAAAAARGWEQDLYQVLGLGVTCTAAEIRKAYLMLSLKHHPDKGGDPEEFKIVSRAYGVLSDSKQRQTYDAKRG